ncbi:MAG: DUF5069 domain-containing protein [Candidatus Eremiobacteraeota bacterium]|nr:DUF5069 domain-containing protein [Candidatus Eremiobacteraeota bacterium]
MQPLDLTKRPPRSPREKLAGLVMLPRTIDKMRALLPGGKIGDYKIDGFSVRLLTTIGIPVEALQAEVARAASDDEVAQWVLEHSDASKHEDANRLLSQRRMSDVAPEDRPRIEKMYPNHRQIPSGLFFDIIDADDAAAFERS